MRPDACDVAESHRILVYGRRTTMKRIALAALLSGLAACSGGQKPTAKTGSDTPLLSKKFSLSWGIEQATAKADVFLQATDETGKQTSYPVGTYAGDCKVITPAAAMRAVTGVTCTSGVEIDAVVEGAEVVVLKGTGGDPMAREEVTRVAAPPGAKIELAT